MGAWAGGLFESDADLDIISELSDEVGVELNRHGDDAQAAVGVSVGSDGGLLMGSSAGRTFDEDQLLSIKETRAYLDAGNFSRVFDKYKAMKETHHMFGLSFPVAGGNYCCMLLAATAMRVGAAITNEQKEYLRSQYKHCGLMREGIEQMGKALQEYKSGQPYKLPEPDRSEQERDMEAREADSQRTGRILMTNHFGERFFEEGKGTPDFMTVWNKQHENKRCARCKKVEFMLPDGKKLKNCAKCKSIVYCSRECQKHDWKHHKKDCARLASEAAE